MENCIFCKIANDKIPSAKIWEDKKHFVIFDIKPINPGHILVIPKKHVKSFYELENEDYISLMKIVKKLSILIKKNLNPKKVGLLAAGWDVNHTHIHIVPMNDYDDLTSRRYLENKRLNLSQEELNKIAKKILNK